SVSAWLGLPGQVDYAAANAFLDALARRSGRHRSWPVISIGWGAWKEVGMAARLVSSGSPGGAELASRNLHHPLLNRVSETAENKVECTAVLDAESNWVLDGHRTHAGVALLPGTGFLELARAALAEALPNRKLQLRDVVFE